MKLVLLGTGGYFPTVRRHTACVVLPEVGVVLDAGSGMYRLGEHLQTNHLDIFLSHVHLDHVAGLTYLINILGPEILQHIVVHGVPAQLEAVREHLFAPEIFPVPPPFQFRPLADLCPLADGGTLTHFPLEHPGGSTGFRLEWPNHSLAYVTDTTARLNASYVEHIRGVDMLLHEAYYPACDEKFAESIGHSWLSAVVDVAAAADVKRLVLVHIDPQVTDDELYDLRSSRQKFNNIELGRDGMEIEF